MAANDQLLDLCRAFVERRHLCVAQVTLDEVFVRVTAATVYLDGVERRPDGGFASIPFRQRRFYVRWVSGVLLCTGAQTNAYIGMAAEVLGIVLGGLALFRRKS
jgi:hypothetical protein